MTVWREKDPLILASKQHSLTQTNSFSSAGIYDVGFGYQFNNWFRMISPLSIAANPASGPDVIIGAGFGTARVRIANFTDSGDIINGGQAHSFDYAAKAPKN